MKALARFWIALLCFSAANCFAHPGPGIVVDKLGQVFFVETGDIEVRAPGKIWKVDATGHTSVHHQQGAHSLVQDPTGRFANTDLRGMFQRREVPFLERIAATDTAPLLIQADGCPLAFDDGNLYFTSGENLNQGGTLQISRLAPDGSVTAAAPKLKAMSQKLGGITGLAVGPQHSLYVAYPSAVLRVSSSGNVTTIVDPVTVADCDRDLPPGMAAPYLRGLAVDKDSVVYVAANGCRRVLKISPDGSVEIILKSDAPWSPTGVTIFQGAIYVLEYTNANAPHGSEWRPRVRRIAENGEVTTIAEITQDTEGRNHP